MRKDLPQELKSKENEEVKRLRHEIYMGRVKASHIEAPYDKNQDSIDACIAQHLYDYGFRTRPPQNSGAPMTQTFQDELSEKRIGEILKKILWPVHKQKLGWRHHKLMVGEEKALIIQFHKIFATPQPERPNFQEIRSLLQPLPLAFGGRHQLDRYLDETAQAIVNHLEGKKPPQKENPSVGFMGETL